MRGANIGRQLFPLVSAGLAILAGCGRSVSQSAQPAAPVAAEQYVADPNSVGFDIEPAPSPSNTTVWLARYSSQGKTARFKIEIGRSKTLPDQQSKEFDIQSGKGRFLSEPGSDASVLLTDLRKALEAKAMPRKITRVTEIPFEYVSLGSHQSQANGGGFNTTPPGNWTPMKIFLGKGDQQAEVFLNLNPVLKKGQFSIKDEEYGDAALGWLAQVL